MSEKARKDKSAKIAANSSHVGYNGTDSDLSGRLSVVSLGHSRHAGASRPADEKMVNVGSAEGSSAGLNRALPPNMEALEASKSGAERQTEKH